MTSPRIDRECLSLAKLLPHGKVLGRFGGRLKIEGKEEAMDALMSEINAAYYRGKLDIRFIDVFVQRSKSKSGSAR